jgi:hypothetical protein
VFYLAVAIIVQHMVVGRRLLIQSPNEQTQARQTRQARLYCYSTAATCMTAAVDSFSPDKVENGDGIAVGIACDPSPMLSQ